MSSDKEMMERIHSNYNPNKDNWKAAWSSGIAGALMVAFVTGMFYSFQIRAYDWATGFGYFAGVTSTVFVLLLIVWSVDRN